MEAGETVNFKVPLRLADRAENGGGGNRTRVVFPHEPRGCARCHGDGTVTIAAYAGLRRDPENDHDERCPDCAGTGIA